MLAGRGDLASVEQFNKGMAKYSDDGKGLNGAYGWRWRGMFGFDQLTEVVNELSINPTSRRCVLAMYDPVWDMQDNPESLDIPCNTHIYFDCRHNKLNMTVCCRSNDALWGAYGANAVHMSMLMEYIAAAVGLPCLVLWGDSDAEIWRPPSEKVTLLRHPPGLARLPVAKVLQHLRDISDRPAPAAA